MSYEVGLEYKIKYYMYENELRKKELKINIRNKWRI